MYMYPRNAWNVRFDPAGDAYACTSSLDVYGLLTIANKETWAVWIRWPGGTKQSYHIYLNVLCSFQKS